jgi:hypothetical protein
MLKLIIYVDLETWGDPTCAGFGRLEHILEEVFCKDIYSSIM